MSDENMILVATFLIGIGCALASNRLKFGEKFGVLLVALGFIYLVMRAIP